MRLFTEPEWHWAVQWESDDGGSGCNFCETYEDAEVTRDLLLGVPDVKIPTRTNSDGVPRPFMMARPANAIVTAAWIEPYTAPASSASATRMSHPFSEQLHLIIVRAAELAAQERSSQISVAHLARAADEPLEARNELPETACDASRLSFSEEARSVLFRAISIAARRDAMRPAVSRVDIRDALEPRADS
jgi:hypothetical protein